MRKGERFLKLIIVYKALIGLTEAIAATVFHLFIDTGDAAVSFTSLAKSLNLDPGNPLIRPLIDTAGSLGSGAVTGITATVFAIGVINCVEAAGLFYRQKWAEWLTVIATGALIPFELYEVMESASVLKVAILAINIAVVYYLGKHRELFGKKTGKKTRDM